MSTKEYGSFVQATGHNLNSKIVKNMMNVCVQHYIEAMDNLKVGLDREIVFTIEETLDKSEVVCDLGHKHDDVTLVTQVAWKTLVWDNELPEEPKKEIEGIKDGMYLVDKVCEPCEDVSQHRIIIDDGTNILCCRECGYVTTVTDSEVSDIISNIDADYTPFDTSK
jgi:hypothetical protein